MKLGWKISIITAVVVLTGLLFFFFWQDVRAEKEKQAQAEAMEKELRSVEVEKRRLQQELDDIDRTYEEKSQGTASLVILFTDLDERIYTDIFPGMSTYGFIGMLAISEEHFPGQTGCISWEHFQELTSAGWKCCFRWDPTADEEEWLTSCRQLAREAQIGMPKTVYFPENTYNGTQDDFLEEQNFTVVVHHGEGNLPLIISGKEKGLWHPGAVAWNRDGVVSLLSDVTSQKGNLVFTVGSDSQAEEYEENGYTYMLQILNKYCGAGELMVTDLQEAMEYRRNLEAGQTDLEKEHVDQGTELEQQIRELDKKIDEIIEKYTKDTAYR